MEGIIRDRINSHLNSHRLISPSQHELVYYHSQKIYWNASMFYRALIAEAAEVSKGLGFCYENKNLFYLYECRCGSLHLLKTSFEILQASGAGQGFLFQ